MANHGISRVDHGLAIKQMIDNRIRARARVAAQRELSKRYYEEYLILYQEKKIEFAEKALEELRSDDR